MQPNNDQNQGNWAYHPENPATTEPAPIPVASAHVESVKPITWTASEFIAHHKNSGWYAGALGGCILLCSVIYLIIHDLISVIAIVIAVILFLIVSGSKPRQRTYTLETRGVSIDEKFYPFSTFKSFALSQEGAIGCISLMPLKRFMPEISIYFAPEDGQQIIDTLTRSLPNNQRPEQAVDRLMKRIGF